MNFEEFKHKNGSGFSSGQGPIPSAAYSNSTSSDGLPSGYLQMGYFDGKGNILPPVVIDWAKDISAKLDQSRMNTSQLRKFFCEVRHIEGQLTAGKAFDSLRGRILKLDTYAANAQKKGSAPVLFKQFIGQNLKWAAQDEKNYTQGFVPHFESVVAYFPKK